MLSTQRSGERRIVPAGVGWVPAVVGLAVVTEGVVPVVCGRAPTPAATAPTAPAPTAPAPTVPVPTAENVAGLGVLAGVAAGVPLLGGGAPALTVERQFQF